MDPSGSDLFRSCKYSLLKLYCNDKYESLVMRPHRDVYYSFRGRVMLCIGNSSLDASGGGDGMERMGEDLGWSRGGLQ